MARAKRHYIPGYVWHITHRFQKREFLLKFPRDRRRWIEWLLYHLSPCVVALPNKRVQSDAAAAAGYRGENWLCNALRIEADFGKVAARLRRRALNL
jgi:hypothetical protein